MAVYVYIFTHLKCARISFLLFLLTFLMHGNKIKAYVKLCKT